MLFSYEPVILARFPDIRAGVLAVQGLTNDLSSEALRTAFREEQQTALVRLQTTSIADMPSIAAWRRVFTRFGAKPTQYRNAAESLQRRLEKQGEIPSISTLVDLGNLVSIRTALPVAIFDQSRIAGGITVRLAQGNEPFADLGSSEQVHPEPGEVIFVDGVGRVSSRRWCWRQSVESAVGATTTEALIVIEGHHETARADIAAAVHDLTTLLERYQPDCQIRVAELP